MWFVDVIKDGKYVDSVSFDTRADAIGAYVDFVNFYHRDDGFVICITYEDT